MSYVLWHVDTVLGNDRERSSYTTANDFAKSIFAQQQRSGVFCAIRAEML
jgi:hypothetical protein